MAKAKRKGVGAMLTAAALLGGLAGAGRAAQAPPAGRPAPPPPYVQPPVSHDPNRKANFAFTIADPAPGATVDGPGFQRFKAAIAAANRGNGSGFNAYLAPGAKLTLQWFADHALHTAPFTAATIRAATASCLGPFSFDETANWVQLSWVCRVDGKGPLTGMISFHDSPELSLTVWLDKGKISEIVAMEPPPVPMRRYVSMDAYERMRPGK